MWMPREFSRSDRVASQVKRVMAELIQREVKDPRLGFVTVNEVDVSRDLSVAKIFFSTMAGDETQRQGNLEVLAHAAPFLRRELAKRLRMRVTPELRFVYDDSIERGMQMDRILEQLRQEQDEAD
jgi:ribosome-binding factor A